MVSSKYFFQGLQSLKSRDSPAIALACSFIAIGAEKYGKAFSDGKISKEDYHNMDKFLGRFYEIKKLRSRYDKTKAEGYKGAHDK